MNRTKTNLEECVAWPYAVEIVPDEYGDGRRCSVARHPELPGCMAHGATPEEARTELTEARRLYIEDLLEAGLSVPEPAALKQAEEPLEIVWTSADPRDALDYSSASGASSVSTSGVGATCPEKLAAAP